jgi:hypothetical protein
MKIDSCAQEFIDQGVRLPTLEADWKGELFGTRRPVSTPEKRKSSQVASPSPPENVFASKSSVMLGDALRRKLHKGSPDEKEKGSSASASSRRR